jgi:hypothetical protein
MRLNDSAIRNAKPSEKIVKLSDGGGLYLLIQPHGTKLCGRRIGLTASRKRWRLVVAV